MHYSFINTILVKKKNSVKQKNRQISGPIWSDPVIRPDPVNTRTQLNLGLQMERLPVKASQQALCSERER